MEYNEERLENVLGGTDREIAAERLSKLFKEVKEEEKKDKKNEELQEKDLEKYLGGIPSGALEDEEFMEKHR